MQKKKLTFSVIILPVKLQYQIVTLLKSRGGGDSRMKQTGMLVGNFEFSP